MIVLYLQTCNISLFEVWRFNVSKKCQYFLIAPDKYYVSQSVASELHPIQRHLQIWVQDKPIFTWHALNCTLDSLPSGSSQCTGGHTYATHFLPFRNATPDKSDELQTFRRCYVVGHDFPAAKSSPNKQLFWAELGLAPMPEVETANDKRVTIHRTHSLLLQWIVK